MSSIWRDEDNHFEHIETWLDFFGIDHSDIGILLGPEIADSQDALKISYSVRVVDGNYDGCYEIDGSYTFNETDAQTVLNDIYPKVVENFETRFERADIHAYDESWQD